jgi:hypothetical protein
MFIKHDGHATITDVVFRLDEHWQEHPEVRCTA